MGVYQVISILVLSLASLVWVGSVSMAVFGRYYRLRGRGRTAVRNSGFEPSVLVILPCKGTDLTIEANMLSLRAQNYGNYKVIAVVEDRDDPAVRHISSADLDYIIADKKFSRCSGKVKNILSAFKRFTTYDVYVVVDSDVTASPTWLSKLVEPLSNPNVGVTTTYPYFNPIGGFWSDVKSVWNFVGEGMMESKQTRFVWGGSMAFRKELVTKELIKSMGTAVADDLEIHRACRRAGLEVYYVKERIAYVNAKESFASFIEWANRQSALSVLADRKLITYGKLIYGAECLLILMGVSLPFFYGPVWLFLLVPLAIKIGSSYSKTERKGAYVVPVTVLVQFIYLYNITKAARMDSIQWRGREYKIR
jgi:hypothetical protein